LVSVWTFVRKVPALRPEKIDAAEQSIELVMDRLPTERQMRARVLVHVRDAPRNARIASSRFFISSAAHAGCAARARAYFADHAVPSSLTSAIIAWVAGLKIRPAAPCPTSLRRKGA
jgi:hypothetical protein